MKSKAKKWITSVVKLAWMLSIPAHAGTADDPLLVSVMLDQFEVRDSSGDKPVVWQAQGWVGKDLDKFWFKTEGERLNGKTEEAELQALYSKAIAPYWDFQIGAKRNFQPSPSRNWVAVGFQGLAPYFFEIDVSLFIGESGRSSLRLEAEYEFLLTQRLILTPEIEMNFFTENDPDTSTGSGLSKVESGLRLRYEIRREIAPYLGINWSKLSGNTADFANTEGEQTDDVQFLIGIRARY